MAKTPKWQHELERLDSQFQPWKRGYSQLGLPVPLYVQRWILWASREGETTFRPKGFAVDLLTQACVEHFRHAPPLPYRLIGGVTVEPPDKAEAVLRELETRAGAGVCVFNGAFAWFFDVDRETDRQAFRAWVGAAFAFMPLQRLSRAGWPVMVLTSGHWPIDPRLLAGSPVALPELAEVATIVRPPRDVFEELGVPRPAELRLVSSQPWPGPMREEIDDELTFLGNDRLRNTDDDIPF